jgi:CBS domain-containing protein
VTCPACGYENLEGLDQCDNCGADLRTSDIPHPTGDLEQALISAQLADLRPRAPVTVSEDSPVTEVLERMRQEGVGCVLVTRDERLVGIFTERDALLKLAGRELGGIDVGQVMTPDPVVLRGSDNAAVAIHKMAVGAFRHVPLVEDGGRPTGVVSSRDLFRHIVAYLGRAGAGSPATIRTDAPTSTDSTGWPFAEPDPAGADAGTAIDTAPSASGGPG